MILKPNKPWIEFLAIALMLWFCVRLVFLAIQKSDFLVLIPSFLLLAFAVIAIHWTNKEYRKYVVDTRLSYHGFLWGKAEFDFEEIKEFKIKERKDTQTIVPISEFDIVLYKKRSGQLNIRQTNYDTSRVNEFIEILKTQGVKFIGVEKFSWIKSFQDLFKGRIFE